MSNILPKKSWHVYNEDNRERVRKDEEAARAKQEALDTIRKQEERKSRLDELRRKAALETGVEYTTNNDDGINSSLDPKDQKDLKNIHNKKKMATATTTELFPTEEASILKEKFDDTNRKNREKIDQQSQGTRLTRQFEPVSWYNRLGNGQRQEENKGLNNRKKLEDRALEKEDPLLLFKKKPKTKP